MRAVLEVLSGPSAATRAEIPLGQSTRVGREADLSLPDDRALSRVHFALEWDGRACRLRDLSGPAGTLVNGRRAFNATVGDGDRIAAGGTLFAVRVEARGAVAPADASQDLLALLRGQPEPLYALLDAARDPRIIEMLRQSEDEQMSLYDGDKGRQLAEFAPHLVRLPRESPLLPALVAKGWGHSWGVYLTCAEPLREVRRHLRRFLLVRDEAGRELYFRFYDPRVLRVFLPTCDAGQAAEFFGPVGCYLTESEGAEAVLRWTRAAGGVERAARPLASVGG